jgi:hypothetical protein
MAPFCDGSLIRTTRAESGDDVTRLKSLKTVTTSQMAVIVRKRPDVERRPVSVRIES